jgi:PAS domain S-box-containing protein
VAASVIPSLALIGWIAGHAALRGVIPGAVPMNPFTAIGLLLLVAGLAGAMSSRPGLRVAPSLGALSIGLARLVQPDAGSGRALDLVFFRDQILGASPPARMAYSTAICLVALGCGLLLYRPGRARHGIRRLTVMPAAIFALLAATGYLYGAEWFFNLPALHPMALNTALALLALSAGIASLPEPLPLIRYLAEDGTAGVTARRLLPAAFVIPFGLGWLRVTGERSGWFDLGFGTASFVVLTSVLLAALVLISVRQVARAEEAQARLATAVRDSEQRTLRMLDELPTAVFVADAKGQPYYTNRKSQEILGRGTLRDATLEEIAERYQAYEARTGQPYPAGRTAIARALRGESSHSSDVEIHRDGRVVPLEVWGTPIRGEDGVVEFAVAAFNDITERQETARKLDRLNSELAHQLAELAAVNKELETFSYSVSHDLRAPLRAVDGFSRVLETDYAAALDPDALRYLGRIRGNVRRMGALIDDLLRFSRLSRTELDGREVDMASLVRNVVDDLVRDSAQAEVTIGDLPAAEGDLDLLRQVWANLIDNALKYSSRETTPRVEIGGRIQGREIVYSVRDNGVGFDMTYADKLFGVFQRLHRQDEFEGTGVGLAIAQRVVHRHGGRIWAESAPGEGAVFSFTLAAGGVHGGR